MDRFEVRRASYKKIVSVIVRSFFKVSTKNQGEIEISVGVPDDGSSICERNTKFCFSISLRDYDSASPRTPSKCWSIKKIREIWLKNSINILCRKLVLRGCRNFSPLAPCTSFPTPNQLMIHTNGFSFCDPKVGETVENRNFWSILVFYLAEKTWEHFSDSICCVYIWCLFGLGARITYIF